MSDSRPSPMVLWYRAEDEYPTDATARSKRYMELMREHGHVVPGKPSPLPCGWTGERKVTE